MLPSIDSPQGDQVLRTAAAMASGTPSTSAAGTGPMDPGSGLVGRGRVEAVLVQVQPWIAGFDAGRSQLGVDALLAVGRCGRVRDVREVDDLGRALGEPPGAEEP